MTSLTYFTLIPSVFHCTSSCGGTWRCLPYSLYSHATDPAVNGYRGMGHQGSACTAIAIAARHLPTAGGCSVVPLTVSF